MCANATDTPSGRVSRAKCARNLRHAMPRGELRIRARARTHTHRQHFFSPPAVCLGLYLYIYIYNRRAFNWIFKQDLCVRVQKLRIYFYFSPSSLPSHLPHTSKSSLPPVVADAETYRSHARYLVGRYRNVRAKRYWWWYIPRGSRSPRKTLSGPSTTIFLK